MESIERFVLEQLAAWEVPGCAVAVVHDGHVVLAAGWGQRDLETKLPVTSNTLFAIGSTTKAFTAATVGALVEDGLLEWERPLRDYVPEIRLNDPVVTDRLTVIDLLSHRSGLPRHEMVWLGHPGRSRAEVVRRLRFLPLSKDLRQEFQYCNLGYLAAGYAVEMLSGTPWEDYLRTRLLAPLGMSRSNLSAGDMTADPDHATAYERRQGVVVPVPQRPVTALAPAGAVNSCAADMARWLMAQLGGGQVDGRAVMSPGTVARQHAPHIVLPEDRTFPASTRHAYGLGWLVGRYRDHRLLEHGGNLERHGRHDFLNGVVRRWKHGGEFHSHGHERCRHHQVRPSIGGDHGTRAATGHCRLHHQGRNYLDLQRSCPGRPVCERGLLRCRAGDRHRDQPAAYDLFALSEWFRKEFAHQQWQERI